jgi:hypothetical protein
MMAALHMKHRLRWSSLGITAGVLGLLFGMARTVLAQPCPDVIYQFNYLKGTSPDLRLFSDPAFSNIDPDVNLTAQTPTSIDFPPLQVGQYNEIGTWRTGVLFDGSPAGCLDVYTYAYQPHVWVGLQDNDDKDKNKDKKDKIKDEDARFDLKAELFRNDDLVAEGEVRCITGMTRKPAEATEIVIPFPSPDSLLFGGPTTRSAGFYLHNGSELFLRLSARISDNDGHCHAKKGPAGRSSTGLRLETFAADQPARVLLFGAAVCGTVCIDLSAPVRD